MHSINGSLNANLKFKKSKRRQYLHPTEHFLPAEILQFLYTHYEH